MLYYQRGIFVTHNSELYVADTNNYRVQLFRAGQLNGTTMAGREALGTVQLLNPSAVMLDGDGYLFILDAYNYRVVGSGPYGFRCVIGCTNGRGSSSNQLSASRSMAFDSYGNIFIVDTDNNRVQKFFLSSGTCSKCKTGDSVYISLSASERRAVLGHISLREAAAQFRLTRCRRFLSVVVEGHKA